MPASQHLRSPRTVALGFVALTLASVGLITSAPVQAAKPAGAVVDLLIGPNNGAAGVTESVLTDPSLAVTQGVWGAYSGDSGLDGSSNTATYVVGRPTTVGTALTVADHGCPAGDGLGYAFTTASPTAAAANLPGSSERPRVTAGQFAHDVFGWTPLSANQIADTTTPYAQIQATKSILPQASWATLISTGGAYTAALAPVLNKAWPAETKLSLVFYCSSAKKQQVPGARTGYLDDVVATDANGYAITSWVQFVTSADPLNSTLTSSRFTVLNTAVAPTVTVSDSWVDGAGTLTATLTGSDHQALSDASGSVQFAKVAGGTTTAVGGPVAVDSATGTASAPLTGLSAGQQASYIATYTPDEAGSAHWTAATSESHTALAPAVVTSTDLAVTGALVDGQTQTLAATVAPTGAVGKITFKDGVTTLGSVTVNAGTATLTRALAVGSHALTAAFVPDNVAAATASTSSVRDVTIAARPAAVVTITDVHGRYGTATRATVKVSAGGSPVSGTAKVTLDGRSLSTVTVNDGTAVVTLPATLAAGRHTLTATVDGGTGVVSGTGSGAVTIAKALTRTSVTISPKKVTKKVKAKAVITVTVPGAAVRATGKVKVTVGRSSVAATVNASGKVTVKLPKSTKKKFVVVVTYLGTANLAGSTVSTTVKVKR
jgi:hypothetical protein